MALPDEQVSFLYIRPQRRFVRYGCFAAEAKEQFVWINALAQPVEALAEARKHRLEVAR